MATSHTPDGRTPAGRKGPAPSASRERILAAATDEFARQGFAGASVDRIASRARLNKAMIYYHFASKAALYQAILRDMFAATLAEVQAIARRPGPLDTRVDAFVETLARALHARPQFAPIWLRELAEGGRHLDPETFRLVGGIPAVLSGLVREGRRAGLYGEVDPLIVHFSIAGPLLAHLASAPVRERFARGSRLLWPPKDLDSVIDHVKVSVGALLARRSGARLQRVRPRGIGS
jgi:TetR/AcrR family transcriptional regulator